MNQITLQRAAVFLALFLGFGLLIAQGNPATGPAPAVGGVILRQVQQKQDHMDAVTLSKKLIEGHKDFFLVDVRQPWEFDDYHIPGAVNLPLEELLGARGKATLPRDKQIVLYSAGGTHAAQAWVVLVQSGYQVTTLLDGLQGWWRDVMTPTSLKITDEVRDELAYKPAKAVREYFGGSGSPSGKPDMSSPAPTDSAPSPTPTPAAPPVQGKAKGGGC